MLCVLLNTMELRTQPFFVTKRGFLDYINVSRVPLKRFHFLRRVPSTKTPGMAGRHRGKSSAALCSSMDEEILSKLKLTTPTALQ